MAQYIYIYIYTSILITYIPHKLEEQKSTLWVLTGNYFGLPRDAKMWCNSRYCSVKFPCGSNYKLKNGVIIYIYIWLL